MIEWATAVKQEAIVHDVTHSLDKSASTSLEKFDGTACG